MIHIYRATRGRYTKPVPMSESGTKWIDEEYNEVDAPPKCHCGHPKHWEWGKGTRNGQKLIFPTNEMFYQKWHMTKKEMDMAIKQFDMASLEMTPRIICADCAKHETGRRKG